MPTTIALVAQQGDLPSLAAPLQEAGYAVIMLERSPEVYRDVQAHAPHLIIYDCPHPCGAAESEFQRVRALSDVPILVLCLNGDESSVVTVLQSGADGCLSKPYSAAELLARVEAMLRRYWEWRESSEEQPLEEGFIDDLSRSVVIGNKMVSLTPIEYRLLTCLAEREGGVVSRDELCTQVWGVEAKETGSHSLGPCIYYLRRKLERNPRRPELIQTKWGAGYYLARRIRKS